MVSFLKGFSRIPLVLVHGFGAVLGMGVWLLSPRFRRLSIQNAGLAGYGGTLFFLRMSMHMGMGLLEIPYVWFNTQRALDKVKVSNWELVETCQKEGRGILFITPHWGCFEIAARYYARSYPMTVLFRPPKKTWLEAIVTSARQQTQLQTAPANLQGVRLLVKALKRGQGVGMLPDQVPGEGEGVWASFFGRQAQTMILPGRLASLDNVQVIIAGAKRLSFGRGWALDLRSPETVMPTDVVEQAQWFNQHIERVIRHAPEQYLWGYNRYKGDAPTNVNGE